VKIGSRLNSDRARHHINSSASISSHPIIIGTQRHSAKEERDIAGILPLTQTPIVIAVRREEEDNHEVEEVEEKDPATRETSVEGLEELAVKTQMQQAESAKALKAARNRPPEYCVSRKEVSGVNNQREGTEQPQESRGN
jgi:hypothetical protein